MPKKRSQTAFRPFYDKFYSIVLLVMVIFISGCGGSHGALTFKPPVDGEFFKLSGRIVLPEIVETDLARSLKASLTAIGDFTQFTVSAGELSAHASKDGSFCLEKAAFDTKLVLKAAAGKIVLMRRVSANDLYYTDLSKLEISVKTTAEALVWQKALEYGKNLSASDIRAREYNELIGEITKAVKLCMQTPASAVNQSVLDLAAVKNAADAAAKAVVEREEALTEACNVLGNALLRKNIDLLRVYFSPSFLNDFDSSSCYDDIISYYQSFFKSHEFTSANLRIIDAEFMPNNLARLRTEFKAVKKSLENGEQQGEETWLFDAMWRLEGTLWKLCRNFPYKDTHPKELYANARYGEIADAHIELQRAISAEDINVIKRRISASFVNDFDNTSTHNDIIVCAQSRFNTADPKITEYKIDSIKFETNEKAYVKCSGRVKVLNVVSGLDIDSGTVSAVVEWKKEDGIWKISRNLPYRFSHLFTGR